MAKESTYDNFNDKYAGSCFGKPPNLRRLPVPREFVKKRFEEQREKYD